MSQSYLSVRVNETDKKEFENLCNRKIKLYLKT